MDVLEHLKTRHVDLTLHTPSIASDTATFMLYNLSGQLVGYQQYRPFADKKKSNDSKGRYHTWYKDKVAVWGLESLHLTPGVVFVTEGIFDAARLTECGVSALAVLSNNPSRDVKNFLSSLGSVIVAVCDNDAAGRKLAKLGDVVVYTEDKDLGDSSQEFVDALVARVK